MAQKTDARMPRPGRFTHVGMGPKAKGHEGQNHEKPVGA
jgi:hypothetical protein